MMTVETVFKAFGGQQNVANLLHISAQAVSNMKQRGSIPSRHWSKLVSEARERRLRGISFESLSAIASPTELRNAS